MLTKLFATLSLLALAGAASAQSGCPVKVGGILPLTGSILTVETNAGVSGVTTGGVDARSARYLLGRNPLQREIIWHDLKRANRGQNGTPPGSVDIALWDLAGKLYGIAAARCLPDASIQATVKPPLTVMFWPLTNAAWSPARNVTTPATSSGVPQRPAGIISR